MRYFMFRAYRVVSLLLAHPKGVISTEGRNLGLIESIFCDLFFRLFLCIVNELDKHIMFLIKILKF